MAKEKHFLLLTKNQIDLKLVKVKGHSDIELNEKVDKLAKETGNIDSCFSNRFNYSHDPNIRDSLKNNDGSTESTCGIIEWDITCRFLGSLSALDGCDSIAKQITSASHRSSKFIADNMADI
ncbi:unnamed protein product [Rhizophagus irregularis]|nr:unnamed protein product [Rhizophagus irregularis]